jgi:hypothetical protein
MTGDAIQNPNRNQAKSLEQYIVGCMLYVACCMLHACGCFLTRYNPKVKVKRGTALHCVVLYCVVLCCIVLCCVVDCRLVEVRVVDCRVSSRVESGRVCLLNTQIVCLMFRSW